MWSQNKQWWQIFKTRPYFGCDLKSNGFHWIWAGWWLITFEPKFEISFLPD